MSCRVKFFLFLNRFLPLAFEVGASGEHDEYGYALVTDLGAFVAHLLGILPQTISWDAR